MFRTTNEVNYLFRYGLRGLLNLISLRRLLLFLLDDRRQHCGFKLAFGVILIKEGRATIEDTGRNKAFLRRVDESSDWLLEGY